MSFSLSISEQKINQSFALKNSAVAFPIPLAAPVINILLRPVIFNPIILYNWMNYNCRVFQTANIYDIRSLEC